MIQTTINAKPTMKAVATRGACALATLAAALQLACGLLVPTALAKKTIETPVNADGTHMGVSDDITRLHVSKLDSDTHEFVPGAKMAVIVKDTGEVVDEWVTGTEVHQIEKVLNVDTVYILREVEPPEGFGAVGDTEFVVDATEGVGIHILSKDDSTELSEAYKVSLYDTRAPVEKEVTEERERRSSSTPRTGDAQMQALIAGASAAAVAALVAALVAAGRMRRNRREP